MRLYRDPHLLRRTARTAKRSARGSGWHRNLRIDLSVGESEAQPAALGKLTKLMTWLVRGPATVGLMWNPITMSIRDWSRSRSNPSCQAGGGHRPASARTRRSYWKGEPVSACRVGLRSASPRRRRLRRTGALCACHEQPPSWEAGLEHPSRKTAVADGVNAHLL